MLAPRLSNASASMNLFSFGAAALALWALVFQGAATQQREPGAATPAGAKRGPFVMERGEGRQPIRFPRDEELVYDVALSLGVLGSPTVGKVTLTSKVEPYHRDGAQRSGAAEGGELEQALVAARAEGSYAVYSVEEVISTRVLPQVFPRLVHSTVQKGTENRRRELLLGRGPEGPTATYRSDGHCKDCEDRAHFVKPTWPWDDAHHCGGCKRGEHRVWRGPRSKPTPDGVVDMVSAVMLARTMVEQGRADASFMLVDRDKLWEIELARGRRGRRKTKAGEFDVVEVLLNTRPPKTEGAKGEEFVGLFGLHGSISIWMHPESGVPVAITGLVPAGPITLDVSIELVRFRGAPEAFRAVVKPGDRR
jgi:hypothetical protein